MPEKKDKQKKDDDQEVKTDVELQDGAVDQENQANQENQENQENQDQPQALAEGEIIFSCFKCKQLIKLSSDYKPQRITCECGTKYRVLYRKGQLSVLTQK